MLFQLNSNLCCKSQNYIVSNLCQEPFLCHPSQLPKIPHFHSMSAANAWASAHALSMVMWYNQKIVVCQCLVVYTLELWLKYWVMSWCCTCNYLLGCNSVLLMYFVHPLYTFLKVPTRNLFTVQACLHVSHWLILLICSRRGRKDCLHRVLCPLFSPRSVDRLLC